MYAFEAKSFARMMKIVDRHTVEMLRAQNDLLKKLNRRQTQELALAVEKARKLVATLPVNEPERPDNLWPSVVAIRPSPASILARRLSAAETQIAELREENKTLRYHVARHENRLDRLDS